MGILAALVLTFLIRGPRTGRGTNHGAFTVDIVVFLVLAWILL